MIAAQWFLWFIMYSFIGWVYETALCSIVEKKPVNRGFLNGPVCPIYGIGALLVVAVFYGRTENVFYLFFGGLLLTCTAEYCTAYLLEKLFDTKWWDYSNHRFNIKGRVSLIGALIFGALSVVLILYVHPLILDFTVRVLPDPAVLISAAALFLLIVADIIVTVRHILLLNGRLREIQEALNRFVEHSAIRAEEIKSSLIDKFEDSEFYNENIKKLFDSRRFQDRRLARAFPGMIPKKYGDAWQRLKEIMLGSGKKK